MRAPRCVLFFAWNQVNGGVWGEPLIQQCGGRIAQHFAGEAILQLVLRNSCCPQVLVDASVQLRNRVVEPQLYNQLLPLHFHLDGGNITRRGWPLCDVHRAFSGVSQ